MDRAKSEQVAVAVEALKHEVSLLRSQVEGLGRMLSLGVVFYEGRFGALGGCDPVAVELAGVAGGIYEARSGLEDIFFKLQGKVLRDE